MVVRFEVSDERGVGVVEGDYDRFGIAFGAFCARVRVIDREEDGCFFRTEGFEAVSFDGGHIDVGNALLFCELS